MLTNFAHEPFSKASFHKKFYTPLVSIVENYELDKK